jgi:GWxTD domain-containing protein
MIHLINGIAEAWFGSMASAAFQATLLALFILGMFWIGRHWPPALRHALLMLALCKFVIPPMMSLPTGLFNLVTPKKWLELAVPKNENRSIDGLAGFEALPLDAMSMIKHPAKHEEKPNQPAITVKGILFLLYLLGFASIFTLAALQKARLHRLVSRSFPVKDPAILEIYAELGLRMKLRSQPRLLVCKDNNAPITFGAWDPVVLLPQALVETLPLVDIQVILGHELAHHKRLDPWLAWIQLPISALWWFNPVYWLLIRSIRSVREDCCDDMVLASGIASREVYCQTLLHAAQAALQNSAITRAAFAYFEKSQPLRRRFTRIMSVRLVRPPKLAMAGTLAIFVLALVLLPGIEPRILAQNAGLPERDVVKTTTVLRQHYPNALEAVNKDDSEITYSFQESRSEQPQAPKSNSISDYFRKWVEEDVAYIITLEEKNEFLALRNNNERESFIEQFWTRRGPSFKAEHYRRIDYANNHFASSLPGWKTDQGRVYIVFGSPDQIESHSKDGTFNDTGKPAAIFPFVKWWYRHIDGLGDDIEIVFIDTLMNGEYRMAMSQDEKENLITLPAH